MCNVIFQHFLILYFTEDSYKQQIKIDDYTALLDILDTGGKLQFATMKDPFPTMRDQFTTIHINFFKKSLIKIQKQILNYFVYI